MAVIETPTAPLTPKPLIIERDYARENYQTQQSIAASTAIMAYTGIAALILSAVGVILIWRTFAQTRRATQAAQATVKSFKDAERGTLTIKNYQTYQLVGDPAEFQIKVGNEGRALVLVRSIGLNWSHYGNLPHRLKTFALDTPISSGGEGWLTCPIPDDRDGESYLSGFVEYADQFGDIHRTHFCLEIEKEEKPPAIQEGQYVHIEFMPYRFVRGPLYQVPRDY